MIIWDNDNPTPFKDMINQVICGDCLDVMKHMPDKSVDLVLTDPPYGINLNPQRGITEPIINDTPEEAKDLLVKCLIEFKRILKDDTHLFIFGVWSEFWFQKEIAETFKIKSCFVWVKNNFGIGYYTRPQHEFIWNCHNGKPERPKKPISDVIKYNKVLKPIHSCEKPYGLIYALVDTFFKKNLVALDYFIGSGTTTKAFKEFGCKFIGIEKELKYCEIAERRLAQEYLF